MDCEKANELIPLYLDQSLDDAETNELRAHLLQCKACKMELIYLEEVISKLQTMPKQALPLGYHEELMEKIRASASAQTKKKSMAPWMGAGVAAAVIAVAVYAGGGFDTMFQNNENGIVNNENQKEIVTAPEGAEAFYGGSEVATGEEAAPISSEEVFENMDNVDVLDTAEANAATGSLPSNLQGSVISSVVPSDEEFIIIDDIELAVDGLAVDGLADVNSLAAPIATEPIIAEAPPQEVIPSMEPIPEQAQTILLMDVAKTRSGVAENVIADTQNNVLTTTNEPTQSAIAPSDTEVAWEIIPEEDLLVTGDIITTEIVQPLEGVSEVSERNVVQSSAIPIMESQPKESAIGLKSSGIVSISMSATNMHEIFQMVSEYVLNQGGMVLHEVLPAGLADANSPIIPENRILYKIPKAVYETTIAELSKFSIISDYAEWEAPMDMAYEVLKQERNILAKNGYQNLEAQLAEYDRKMATWEQEEEYITMYLTILENKSVEK